jgi:hypothetical protein
MVRINLLKTLTLEERRQRKRAYEREWQHNHKDRVIAARKKNSDQHKEYTKEWYKKNRDRLLAERHEKRIQDKAFAEKSRAYAREWHEKNRDHIRANAKIRYHQDRLDPEKVRVRAEQRRLWRIKNNIEIRERERKYKQKNLLKLRAEENERKRRDRVARGPGWQKQQERYGRPDVKAAIRAKRFLKVYGITLEQYDDILASQGGGCAICGVKPGNKHLAVDHCHKNNVVRGLLCHRCNAAIGLLKDMPGLCIRAATYLRLFEYCVQVEAETSPTAPKKPTMPPAWEETYRRVCAECRT